MWLFELEYHSSTDFWHERGRVMSRVLLSGVCLLSTLMVFESAKADEPPVKPKRERAAAPARTAPQRTASTQSSNWSGGQMGGSNGASSVNNGFVEPAPMSARPAAALAATASKLPSNSADIRRSTPSARSSVTAG